MSEVKHTPGPWVAVEIGQGGPADAPMPVFEIQSADGHAVIAEYVDAKNAPVLAAAPDLLSIAQRWAALDGGDWHVARHASDKAELLADTRAAVSRALDETPLAGPDATLDQVMDAVADMHVAAQTAPEQQEGGNV